MSLKEVEAQERLVSEMRGTETVPGLGVSFKVISSDPEKLRHPETRRGGGEDEEVDESWRVELSVNTKSPRKSMVVTWGKSID